MNFRGRVIALALTLGMCVTGIIVVFWKQELQYRLPTPIPKSYVSVAIGDDITLPPSFEKGHAYFLHFYSPDCPCSRFNAKHLASLIGKFHDSVSVMIVVSSEKDIAKARSEFGDNIAMISDDNGTLASSVGVYSTPQAAIVDKTQKLYYRGNYNRSRYCTARATNFAELSLIALINNNPPPAFGIEATTSYGCALDDERLANFEFY